VSAHRLAALRGLLDDLSLDAILVSRNANKRYYGGFRLGDAESAGFSGTLLVTRDRNVILADSRYTEQAEQESPGWELVETAGDFGPEMSSILARLDVAALGMEAQAINHADWSALAEAAPGIELHAIDDELVPLRIRKAPDEVDAIGRACAMTDACFTHLAEWVQPGMTEQQVAWELESFFRANGAEGLAFEPLVLAGPRAAMPHGRASDAVIERGNVLLIDFGCIVEGYRSDMTRTMFVGDVSDDIRRYHDAVREAQAIAMDAIRPGVNGADLDAMARERIEREGVPLYGHGLGHGIGMETHERPWVSRRKPAELQTGMVFSVEPGIYLPGITGIRIEDIVALTDAGAVPLTSSPREPVVIGV